jgi:hypothetical protein
VFLFLVTGFPASSFAILEERDDPHFGVGSILYDSDTGLSWLDFDQTVNRSRNYVKTQFGPGGEFEGFRYATMDEVEQLWINAGIPYIGNDMVTENYDPIRALFDLIGYYAGSSTHTVNSQMYPHYMSYLGVVSWGKGKAILHNSDIDGYTRSKMYGHWLVREEIVVQIDIKPGSDPNCINNNGHGAIPVAILSTEFFDATQVDTATVSLDGQAVRVVGKGNTQAHIEDANGDGVDDLVLQIEDEDGTYEEGVADAKLTAQTFDGISIVGTDTICIVP